MIYTYQRSHKDELCAFGEVVGPDGTLHKCYILEPGTIGTYRKSDGTYHPCIPAGDYLLGWTEQVSPEFGRYMIELKDVPGRTTIYIHSGNFTKDTLGCLLCGSTIDTEDPSGVAEIPPGQTRDITAVMYAELGAAMATEEVTWRVLDP